ncbi:phosphodiesterase [Pseudodonghicola flavimaris]|uniref:Phosphodiesterase n=1 Tax=Pseudodonghicola flavimaris TaxID=3050036 RepID=A0ABT7EYA8_9RHOB|nr:phosphodiesterase [Pseudodonghicola flavimaris]MDK3017338.1 phosphodiesterase [Pseudodonghicola flavimaris]
MTLKLVIMSDLHLVPEGEISNTLDTAQRLRQAVDSVITRHADADMVILAGDLADLGEADAYARLPDLIAPLPMPTHLMLGNHDDRPTFLEVFGDAYADENGFVQKVIDAKGHRIILLDSTEPGLVAGRLCDTRLAWLQARLDEAKDMPVIVVLHHHAARLQMPVDRIRLEEPEKLLAVLKTHPNVRHVMSGHVHITTTGSWQGIPFTTIAGGHYSAKLHLPSAPDYVKLVDGPGQYGVILADEEACLVHFENFIDAHYEIHRENFGRLRADRR